MGLEPFSDQPGFAFFRVADGTEGHPQLLVLLDRDVELDVATSTLDQLVFLIDLGDYDAERRRLEGLGGLVSPKEFPQFHWRSLFFSDPEGDRTEFVAYDPSVGAGQ